MHPKWEDLVDRMRELGPVYNQRLITPRKLSSQFFAGRTVVYPRAHRWTFARGPLRGHVARRKTNDGGWQEISQIYVDEELRGNGVVREMVFELIARTPHEVRLFGITSVRTVMSVFEECQMRPVTKVSLPDVEEWASRLGIQERLPGTALFEVPPAPQDKERWLYVR